MANFGILAKIGVDAKNMVKGFKDAGKEGKNFGKAIGTAVKAGALAAGAAITALTVKGMKDFVEFEKKMAEVFTLLPDITKEMEEKMSGDMRKLATTMGVDVIDATNALYQAISAGVPKENASEFLEIASRAAIAGVSDLETSVAAITTVMNGYSMGAEHAERISDVLFSTVKIGVTNFTELGQNIGKVTPLAAELGIEIEEVGAMFAVLTKTLGSGKTAEAGTGIRSMLAELSKEGMKAFENFVDATGTTFPAFIAAGGTVGEALQELAEHSDGLDKSLLDMFSGVEAGMGALTLAKNKGVDLSKALQNIESDAGSTQTAFQVMAGTAAQNWNKMASQMKELGMALGEIFMPLLNQVLASMTETFGWLAEKVKDLATWFAEHPGLLENVAKAMTVLATAVASYHAAAIIAAVVTGTMTTAIAAKNLVLAICTGAWKKLSLAMTASPMGATLAVIGAIVVAMKLWGESADEAAAKARASAESFADRFRDAANKTVADIDSIVKRTEMWTEKLEDLRAEQERGGRGLTAEESRLDLAKSTLEKLNAQLATERLRVPELQKAMNVRIRGNAKFIKGLEDENAKIRAIAMLNSDILVDKKDIKLAQEDIAKLTFAIATQEQLIADTTKKVVEENKKRVQGMQDALNLIKGVRREHDLDKTTMGKIVIHSDRLNQISKERKGILKDIWWGNKGDKDSVKKLSDLEKERLQIHQTMADLLENDLNNLRKEEIDLLEQGKAIIEKELADELEIVKAQERKLEIIKGQVAEQEKKVKAAHKEIIDIAKPFMGDKFDFRTKERIGVGEFKLSSSKLRQEYLRLKEAGQLPEGVKTYRDFKKHVEEEIRAARAKLNNEWKKKQDLLKQQKAVDDKKKEAEDRALGKQLEKEDEEKRILDLRKAMNAEEVKTLQQITTERIRLEDALRKFRDVAEGAQLPQNPPMAQVMGGAHAALAQGAGLIEKFTEKFADGMGDKGERRGEGIDIELPDIEGEGDEVGEKLDTANASLGDIRNTLEGKFVNQ